MKIIWSPLAIDIVAEIEGLYETIDKIEETRGRSACGAHFSPELLESLVSLFVVGLRPMWVI